MYSEMFSSRLEIPEINPVNKLLSYLKLKLQNKEEHDGFLRF